MLARLDKGTGNHALARERLREARELAPADVRSSLAATVEQRPGQ